MYPMTVAMLKAIATERKGSFFGMVMNDNEFEQRKRKFKPRKTRKMNIYII